MACLPFASALICPLLAFCVSGVGQLSPEGTKGEAGTLGYDTISGDAELSGSREVHPGFQPISHATNLGFRRRRSKRESDSKFPLFVDAERRREVGADCEDSSPCVGVSGAWWENGEFERT